MWGTLLPSSESSSAGSSCGSELLLGQHEIFVEFNMKVNNSGATSVAARLGSLFTSPVASALAGLEEDAGLKACLARKQRRKQGGADIHPQSHSPGIILISPFYRCRD